MKKMTVLFVTLIAATVTAQSMTYTQARTEALFLTDKMAYELGLSESQYDAVYEINLDYMMSLTSSSSIYGTCWTRRDLDLSYVLTAAQYSSYMEIEYFYRPVYWSSGFKYRIYTHYTDRSLFYYSKPSVYTTYCGGHSWNSNGGQSWYRGRTFSSGKVMTQISTGRSVTVTSAKKNSKTTTSGHSAPAVSAKKKSGSSKTATTGSANHSAPSTTSKTGNTQKTTTVNFGGKR